MGGLAWALPALALGRLWASDSPGNGTVCERWRVWFWWDMTAAWAAIWLAVRATGETGVWLPWAIVSCDRLETLVDGSDESNMPCVAECLRWWPPLPTTGDAPPPPPPLPPGVTTRLGREKLWCRLELLELAWAVNWKKTGVTGDEAPPCWRDLPMVMGGGGARTLSSLSEESTRRRAGRGGGGWVGAGGMEAEADAPDRGGKLPGARADEAD
jgi:hypothetical protein